MLLGIVVNSGVPCTRDVILESSADAVLFRIAFTDVDKPRLSERVGDGEVIQVYEVQANVAFQWVDG